jgi:hypothetical protein
MPPAQRHEADQPIHERSLPPHLGGDESLRKTSSRLASWSHLALGADLVQRALRDQAPWSMIATSSHSRSTTSSTWVVKKSEAPLSGGGAGGR